MKVSVNTVTGCTKEVLVEVPADKVQTKVDEIYRRISQDAKLPGFRKGKAPLEAIRKEYKSNVREQILQYELPEFFREAVKTEKVDPIAQPRITELNFEEGSPLKFTARVEVKPEFDLKNYKNIKVKKDEAAVSEADVDKTLEGLRDQMAQIIPVEETRLAKTGDILVIDFDGQLEGKPFEGGKATRYSVVLGGGNMLKDFEDALIGMKKDETKTFKLKFPDDYFGKQVAGKEVDFTVVVHELKEKKLPMVDNEFAKDVGKCETVAELRQKIEEDIKARRAAEQRAKLTEQIGDQLIKDHAFDVPESLVDAEQKRLIQQGVERMRHQGVDANKLNEEQKKDFVEKMRPIALRNVHIALIVEKISDKENIQCEPKDFEDYIVKMAKNVNQPPDVIKRYIQQQGNQESIQDWIRYEKTLDFLIAEAKTEAA